MGILWGKLIGWLSAAMLTFWTAKKVFILGTFLSFLAIILYNMLVDGMEQIMNAIQANITTVVEEIEMPDDVPTSYQFIGLTGWLLNCFKIPECVSFIVNIVLLKFALKKIPFIKW